jgi:hypothetical protein
LTRRQTARDASRRIAKRKLRDFRVARVALAEDPRLWFLGEPLEPRLAGDDSDEDDCFDGPIEGRKVVLAIDEMLREAYCVPQELRGVGAFRARTTPQLPQTADFCSSRVAAIADESGMTRFNSTACARYGSGQLDRSQTRALGMQRSGSTRNCG